MIGKSINGYKIIAFKGSGSFGSVYICERNSKKYAIKIFNSNYVFSQFSTGADNRITREIQALKIVNHPNVVSYVDEGLYDDNGSKYVYVVMDYVDGENLKDYASNHNLDIPQIINIFKNILNGINAIHLKHIIHRDLKPDNIYITQKGEIKILDFGLSKLIDYSSITSTGATIGSPLYMSPEQLKDSKNIDYRSDYYSIGVILYELISKTNPYGKFASVQELYYKILNEPIISIRQYVPTIDNGIDNLLFSLLDKNNYNRPNSISDILAYFSNHASSEPISRSFAPSFFLRTWNEKTVLEEYSRAGFSVENYIFPINHQSQQKNLLNNIIKSNATYIIDPATMRLAYDSFSDVKGLTALPYAPKNFNRLELDDLKDLMSKQKYVKQVIDEQLKYNPSYIVSPFHVSNNSNLVKIKAADEENWFSLDAKLLYESRDYLKSINSDKKLISGICIKNDILTTRTEKEYFLNVISALPCDAYWVYVDCIDNSSNIMQLYNYADTLLTLQKVTKKPVIAGRIGPIGLILLAFGLFAFESGASRFERFDEDLFKPAGDPYNLYVNYYFPELLRNVPVERKNPAKIISLLSSSTGKNIACQCPFCSGKLPQQLADDKLAKKHFLYVRQQEIETLRALENVSDRVNYVKTKIENAISYHQSLKPIFKPDEYSHLKTWLSLIDELKKKWA